VPVQDMYVSKLKVLGGGRERYLAGGGPLLVMNAQQTSSHFGICQLFCCLMQI